MAINFPSNPSNGDTVAVGGINYVYDSTQGVWSDSPQGLAQSIDSLTDVDTSTTTPANRQVLQWSSTDNEWGPADSGVQVYATIDDLPLSGVTEGSMALVDSTDKLYIFSDTGWYSIAIVNQTPSISGVSATYSLATDGSATTVTVTATDPEGLPLTYSIVSDTSGNIATVSQGTGANTNQWTITPSTNTANAGNFTLVFRASDGTNVASASSTFTLQFSVENSNYTTALITSVGANNAVNNSFDDASTNNLTITATGNATQNTFSPYRHGGYSTYFDGTGDRVDIPDHNDLDFGTGDFTLEFWAYMEDGLADGDGIISKGNSGTGWQIIFANTNRLKFIRTSGNGSSPQISSAVDSVTKNTWTHIALTRSGTTVTLWINGSSAGTYTDSSSWDTSEPLRIGTNRGENNDFVGYISDVRVVKGTAITPPSGGPTERLTAVTNTSLLTCHLPYIADGSTNSHSITINGDTKTEPFAPYDYQSYSSSNHGGSMHLDGSGDYVEIDDGTWLTLGNGNFCFETWIYNTATSGGSQYIFGQGNSAGQASSISVEMYINSNRTLSGGIYVGSQKYATSTGTIPTNIWTHVALVRNGTNIQLYINGTKDGENTSAGTDSAVDQSTHFSIGRGGEYNGLYFNGNIADFRFVKGDSVRTGNFTPPTAPLTAITNTELLVQSTDAGIIDKSQSVQTLTLNGDVKSSTTQTKYLSSSMYFDGTGDYIDIPLDADSGCDFSTGDFTIEGWFYIASLATYYIADTRNPPPQDAWAIFISSSRLYFFDGQTSRSSTNAPATGQWVHFAITRQSNAWRMFLDGSLEAGPTSVTRSINGGTRLRIGASGATTPGSPLNGYLSDFRITKGLARYTSNFTAPTAALQG